MASFTSSVLLFCVWRRKRKDMKEIKVANKTMVNFDHKAVFFPLFFLLRGEVEHSSIQ